MNVKYLQDLFCNSIKEIISKVKKNIKNESMKNKLIDIYVNPNVKEME
jgi:hypothetical protein